MAVTVPVMALQLSITACYLYHVFSAMYPGTFDLLLGVSTAAGVYLQALCVAAVLTVCLGVACAQPFAPGQGFLPSGRIQAQTLSALC